MIAKEVQKLVCQPCVINDEVITIGVSIGINLYPDDSTEMNNLIHEADKQIYQCKQTTH